MKITRFITLAAVALATVVSLPACSDKHSDDGLQLRRFSINAESSQFKYDADGRWTDADKGGPNEFAQRGLYFSHIVNPAQGTIYGFEPSMVSNTTITEGISGYMCAPMGYKTNVSQLAYFNVHFNPNENTDDMPLAPSCKIHTMSGYTFYPVNVIISNNSLTYDAMKNTFTTSGKCELLVYGYGEGKVKGPVRTTLGSASLSGFTGLEHWTTINLESLGQCDYIFFQMVSTDASKSLPTYFSLYSIELQMVSY